MTQRLDGHSCSEIDERGERERERNHGTCTACSFFVTDSLSRSTSRFVSRLDVSFSFFFLIFYFNKAYEFVVEKRETIRTNFDHDFSFPHKNTNHVETKKSTASSSMSKFVKVPFQLRNQLPIFVPRHMYIEYLRKAYRIRGIRAF